MKHSLRFLSRADILSTALVGADELLTKQPPLLSVGTVHSLLVQQYGVTPRQIAVLTAERDANYCVSFEDGQQALFKITNDSEDTAVTTMQVEALLHLAAVAPELPVQRVFATVDGKAQAQATGEDGRLHAVRLVSFLEGTLLNKAAASAELYSDIGRTLARLTLALRGYFHPAAGHMLHWDLKQAHLLRPMLSAIDDVEVRARVDRVLARFDDVIAPRLPVLRAQIVHNDFNPFNLVADGVDARRITGVIDFGDMVHTPIVCDLAVAGSYHIGTGADPFEALCSLVAGYHSVLPLEEEEISLLPDLLALRNVATLAITAWRAKMYPTNRAYILRNVPASLRSLDALETTGIGPTSDQIRTAIETGPGGKRP
ncbi:phosphotransferase [Devosia sp. A369]